MGEGARGADIADDKVVVFGFLCSFPLLPSLFLSFFLSSLFFLFGVLGVDGFGYGGG